MSHQDDMTRLRDMLEHAREAVALVHGIERAVSILIES